ncbi:MAG TPA: glycosyltransferase family 4 protein [Opitutaceae bacterium]|nr:glycosyltransferase family 4 protein [Opitutaceae bacterium]
MTTANQPRLAVVLSHPTQYYSPWFRWLRGHAPLDFRVFYLWDFGVTNRRDPEFGVSLAWDVDLLSGYDADFVPNRAARPGTGHFWGLRNPALPGRLAAWRPDAVLVFGYKYASHLRAIVWCRAHGVPLIFRGDSHLLGLAPPGVAKRALLRLLYRQFAAVTYVGAANRDYFEAFGVPGDRLHFAPHAVDHTLFDPSSAAHRDAARTLRTELGIAADRRVVLFAGKLLPRKQPRALLEAFLAAPRPDTTLVIVGDGGEKPALETRAAQARDADVRFLPFANQSAMPACYLLANLFVLPSAGGYETWGLAVNEAMHMGVPCLVSDVVGCQRDLVMDGATGWVFRAGDQAQLIARLTTALEVLARDAAGLRDRVKQRIGGYTYAQTTDGLLQAVAAATAAHQ